MKEFFKNNWFNITSSISILVNIFLVIYFALKSWSRNRATYKLEKYKFPKNVGKSKTDDDKQHEKVLEDKLKTGNYQIEYIYERNEKELMIVVGKLKK